MARRRSATSARRWGSSSSPSCPRSRSNCAPGDLLVFYTDGVTEAAAPRRLLDRRSTWRRSSPSAPATARGAVVEHLERTAVANAEGNPRDDIACLAIQLTAPTLVSERFTATPHAAHDVADALAPVGDLLGPAHRDGHPPAGHRAGRQRGQAHGRGERLGRGPAAAGGRHRAPERASTRAPASSRPSARWPRPRARAAGACTSSTSARSAGATNVPSATACGSNWSAAMPPEIVDGRSRRGDVLERQRPRRASSSRAGAGAQPDRDRPHRRHVHRLLRACRRC